MIGDADREDLLTRKSDESVYEGMNLTFDPLDMNEIRGFFREMAVFSGREDFLWAATGRKSGHEPEKRNFAFKDAGIYVMRTGWSSTDSYMLVHGVQLERGEKSTHSHNDTGHLELSINGEDILVDCGRYIYNSSCWKDWRHYFTSAVSHNTLYVDDHTMGTVPGVTRVRGVRTHCHEFKETGNYQLVDISHNGYAFMDDPVFHRRRVIRLRGNVFVIDDRISGLGLAEHDFRLYFNFAPGNLEALDKYSCKYRKESGAEYFFTGIVKGNAGMVYLKGSEEPKGGWISSGYPVRKPTPQLYITSRGPVPLRFISVISPSDIRVTGSGDLRGAKMEIAGAFNYSAELKGDDIIVV
jgi:hypothetical protein